MLALHNQRCFTEQNIHDIFLAITMKPVKLKADISGRLIPISRVSADRRASLPGKQNMRVRAPPSARVLIVTRHRSSV
ncbi:unnamed protein product [Heligmosomoides polygyrus]|uniref:Transposase n=1 Tax=Heligmosomoides polygyrus TaxID=6339 RepID=A0A183G5L7_HELPZ|nr:unnamed protein product [Heligmosomoides polygyrus]